MPRVAAMTHNDVPVEFAMERRADCPPSEDSVSVTTLQASSLAAGKSRMAVQLCAAFILYWISLGLGFAEGIVYARLILPPCTGSAASLAPVANTSFTNMYANNSALNHSALPESNNVSNVSIAVINQNDSKVDDCGGFGAGASRTAWVSSLGSGMRITSAVLTGVLADTFGMRNTVLVTTLVYSLGLLLSSYATSLYHLYLTRGVMTGAAAGILFTVPIHCLALTFGKKMAMATGVAYFGAGVGVIVYSVAGKAVIASGDWQWYYRMAAMIGLLGIPAAFAIYIDPGNDSDLLQGQETGKKLSASAKLLEGFKSIVDSFRKGAPLYRKPDFLLMVASAAMFSLGFYFPVIASSHRSEELGISFQDAYTQVTYIGGGYIAGCFAVAVCGFLFAIRGTTYRGTGLLLTGSVLLLSLLATTQKRLIAYIIVYSIMLSVTTSALGASVREVVSSEMTGHTFGHLYFTCAPFMFAGPPLSGWIYDATQSYTLPTVFGSLTILLAGVLMLVLDVKLWRAKRFKQLEKKQSTPASTSITDALVNV